MPFRRPGAEALRETIEELPGERDLRHQDEALLLAPHDLGDRLKVDFGLAGTGDAVDQGRREFAAGDARAQRLGCGALRVGKFRLREIGLGRQRNRIGR